MKKLSIFTAGLCAFISVCFSQAQTTQKYTLDDFRNYFGGSWGGSPDEILQYCKNMAIRHIMYVGGMEKNKLADGTWFYFESPEYLTYSRNIDLTKARAGKYPKKLLDAWHKDCAIIDAKKPFPDNLATGWFFDDKFTICSLILDFQQKRVVDNTVDKITSLVREKLDAAKKNGINLKFGGYIWDVPQPTGDFYGILKGKKRPQQVEMVDIRGVDSVDLIEGNTHEYRTFSEGMLTYYNQLRNESKKINPDVKFIIDPAFLWEHWQKHIDLRSDMDKYPGAYPDLITEEFHTTEFVDDVRVFKSGKVKKNMVATSTFHCWYDPDVEILTVGAAAENGAWSTFFGHMGPGCKSVRDVPARMKISRFVATWENLNNTPIAERKFDRKTLVYESPTAQMGVSAFAARNPETKEIFFCFVKPDGKIKLPKEYIDGDISRLDGVFSKIGNVMSVERVNGESVYKLGADLRNAKMFTLRNGFLYPANNAVLNEAFSIKISQ